MKKSQLYEWAPRFGPRGNVKPLKRKCAGNTLEAENVTEDH